MTDADIKNKRLHVLMRHIQNVQRECLLLAERLMENGEVDFARHLIANSMGHDNTKFFGIEWDYLHTDIKDNESDKFLLAATQHVTTNAHHPEFWFCISNMPRIYLAETVCDWKSRSDEFGNDIKEWIKDQGVKKYGFSLKGQVYKSIKEFVDMLLDPPFKKVK